MGLLIDGKWHDQWYDTKSTGGKFVRTDAQFRNWVTPDGGAGPTGSDGFAAERDRYHLYVSLACPWAHRTLIFRELKGLQEMIGVTVVDWYMGENGWEFTGRDGADHDTLNNVHCMWEIYTKANPSYSGRVTVPVLWDKQRRTIVSNESSEIIRMLNSAFDGIGAKPGDYYPLALRKQIDAINVSVYDYVNNGVYKCGFATTQEAYDKAFVELFAELDRLEDRLSRSRYVAGGVVTEADWRLFTTLIRFDAVYVGHFKCNLRRIDDYPNLSSYLRELYQMPGIAATVNMRHIRHHYYGSHETINPHRIVPGGPELDFDAAHDRARLACAA
ncbi:MAG: glutathione S-transferase family protein [Nitratireductor sp.]